MTPPSDPITRVDPTRSSGEAASTNVALYHRHGGGQDVTLARFERAGSRSG